MQLLQLAYAQEQNEETDETEGEDSNYNGEEEDENDRQTNSIDICCSWDERLADGILTYRII